MRIGVDLGGTKIEALALADDGRELVRRRRPTPAESAAAVVAAVAELVAELETEVGERGSVGIATPGAISPRTGLMKNSNTVSLNGQPMARLLEAGLGRELRIANDANCFALSEAVDGAAAAAGVVFGVIVGTGTGGGVVVDGRVLVGPNAVAGEWGHNTLPWPEADDLPLPRCYCGKLGCIETYLSGAGVVRDYAAHGGAQLTAAQIAARAAQDDEIAAASIARWARRLGRALTTVIHVLDPDVVVLGGGLSNVAAAYELAPEELRRHAFGGDADTPIVRAKHGDSSGVRGAAWLWGGPRR